MDTDQIVRMKSELNSELACEQTFTPSAPSLYPTLSVLDNLPDKPRKAIEQTKYSWEMIYLAAFTVWAALGVFGKDSVKSFFLPNSSSWIEISKMISITLQTSFLPYIS